MDLRIHPVTHDRWPDMVELFERPGPRGAWSRTGACYCMFWRLEPAAYESGFRQRALDEASGGPNKTLMNEIVARGTQPGLLAYRDGRPVGWVAISPRTDLTRLRHSPGLRSDEDDKNERTWSISCFYVYRSEWRTGVGTKLLKAAVARADDLGAAALEAYPVKAGNVDPYTGYDSMLELAGFRQVKTGRGLGRSLWRRELTPRRTADP